MRKNRCPARGRVRFVSAFAVFLCALYASVESDPAGADDKLEDLRALLAREEEHVKALEERLAARKAAADPTKIPGPTVRQIIADYLGDNPGAGMPSGVQTGYAVDEGFYLRSTSSPRFPRSDGKCAVPFRIGVRGGINFGYSYYKVTDDQNHLTGLPLYPGLPDFAQLGIRYARLDFGGFAFDPNLRYQVRIEGFTRALPGIPNSHLTTPQYSNQETGDTVVSNTSFGNPVRLGSQTFIAYDFHPGAPECPTDDKDKSSTYKPTVTVTAGRLKPLVGLEGYLAVTSGAVIERGIANNFFRVPSATSAGTLVKADQDRFFFQALVGNSFEGTVPNVELGHLPGANAGLWYDFGGTWDEERKRWDLFGTTLVDLAYSRRPVLRVGGGFAFEPLDSRQLYGDAQSSQIFVMPAGPLGTRLNALLDGIEKSSVAFLDPYAVNRCNDYTCSAFVAGKYRGFNLLVEGWWRDLNNFAALNHDAILYQVPGGAFALFPNHALNDFGVTTQTGYFLVPRKFLMGARWSTVIGESGNIFGNGLPPFVVGSVNGTPVLAYPEAFRRYGQANEFTISAAYYFRGNNVKWESDLGRYTGGNPAPGRATTGYVPGADGWLLRTRVQLLF